MRIGSGGASDGRDAAAELRRRLLADRGPELRALHRLRPWTNLKILGLIAVWLAGVALSVADLGPWRLVPAWTLCTCGLYGLAILMHDAAHHNLARSGRWNRWLGFVCGAPALISGTAYRYNHTTHHAVTGTDADPGDLVGAANRSGRPLGVIVLVVLLLGTPLVVPSIARDGYAKADAVGKRQILVEYALIVAALVAGFALVPWPVIAHGWVAPFVFGGLANNLRSLAEHTLTDRADPLRNARTMRPARWIDLVQSNVNYHWEHHLFPGVPWYNLPALHALVADARAEIRPPTRAGYLGWLRDEVAPEIARGLAALAR